MKPNITLISCSFNTPLVTQNMLKSFTEFHPDWNILICENSTNDITKQLLTKSKIPFIENAGALHGPSVNLLLDRCTTDYALLVDTDVIFLRNHTDIFNQFQQLSLTLMGDIVGDRAGKKLYPRVHPWHCFINVKKCKDNNIVFFDMERQKKREERRYDIGSSFFEDIRSAKLSIADFKGQGTYYKHYEGMSWHINRHGSYDQDIDVDPKATHNNLGILHHGLRVLEQYVRETQYLLPKDICYVG